MTKRVGLGMVLAAVTLATASAHAQSTGADDVLNAFDRVFGATPAAHPPPVAPNPTIRPVILTPPMPAASPFAADIAALAEPHSGRIGVAAIDIVSGRGVAVLGDEPFPLASTGKVAIVAAFLEGVDRGRWRLSDMYPLQIPLPSPRHSSAIAPERPGQMMTAEELIERAITRSDNNATDALLSAIGGPVAVDRWLSRAGIAGMHLDRNIATLVRDDGDVNPAVSIDWRDSTTPQAMVQLLSGLYRGAWLSPASRDVLLGAMSRCRTGVHRMHAGIPDEALIGHKTGTLDNTSSDVGIIRTPGGHIIAVAIYVTGQGGKPGRDSRIASITKAIYDGYQQGNPPPQTASRW